MLLPITGRVARRAIVRLVGAVTIAAAAVVPAGARAAFADPILTNSVPPVLSAPVAVVGQPITTDNGTWIDNAGPISYSYSWGRCDASLANCVLIADADGNPDANDDNDYTPVPADEGFVIAAVVAANDGVTFSVVQSNKVDVVAAPANTVAPAISGTFAEGQQLTVDNGTWTGTDTPTHPLEFTYQWRRCNTAGSSCATIPGQNGMGYRLTADDVGKAIKATVTATNDGGSASASSALSAVVTTGAPVSVAVPTLGTTDLFGTTLTATTGVWAGTAPINYAYEWLQCDVNGGNCVQSSHDTGTSEYPLDSSDANVSIKVQVTASNASGNAAADSGFSNEPASNYALPIVGGVAAVGLMVGVDSPGAWNGSLPVHRSYQWERCDSNGDNCNDISGATGATYEVQASDTDHTLRLRVTGANVVGSASAESDPTNVVTALQPFTLQPPAVTGATTRGQTLTTTDGSWTGTPTLTFAYSWRRCDGNGNNCSTEVGTNNTYQLTVADIGHRMRAFVTATNDVGSITASSFATTVVTASVPDAPAPPVASRGNAQISVSFDDENTFDGGSTVTGYTASCTSSNGGTGGTATGTGSPLLVGGLDNGFHYTCTVHATNAIGNSAESVASNQVDPAAVPGAPAAPTVTPNAGSVTVTFSAPVDIGGSPLTGYTATCTSTNGGATGTQPGTASPLTVSGLTAGKTYTCTVHATNTEGDGLESTASSSVIVAGAPVNTVHPSVTGTAIAERTLSSTTGAWSATPAPAFTRQWQRCNAAGGGCINIAGATKATYTVTNADIGARLRVVVWATNSGGSAAATATTAVVRPVPASISGPYYYKRGRVTHSIAFTVAAAAYGDTVWATTPQGNVVGPHFGPHGGTLVGIRLQKPIIGMQVTPSGRGYWLFASDGGVFSFGDAHFYGSTGALRLRAPIVSMATTPSGRGYWLFASDGGVFTFGDARFYGSTGAMHLAHPVVAMLPTLTGRGYWLVTSNGDALRFGDATNIGDVTRLQRTGIIGLVSTGHGYRFVTKWLQLLTP